MPGAYTPLRYPGGKAKLGAFLAAVMRENRLIDASVAEPYAGGAGAALHLLFRGYASRVFLNDIDQGIAAFWRAVLTKNEAFARRVEHVPLTIEERDRQKSILRSHDRGFDLGFAFFFVNRTSRSGIMNAGAIGGRKQEGIWGIDARFNRAGLAARIRAIVRFKNQITVSQQDALAFLGALDTSHSKILTYLDPPYYKKGQQLYTNFYAEEDHAKIASFLRTYRMPWLLTYDACDEVRELYRGQTMFESSLSYSAHEVRRGSELVVLGPTLRPPTALPRSPERKGRRAGFEVVSAAISDR